MKHLRTIAIFLLVLTLLGGALALLIRRAANDGEIARASLNNFLTRIQKRDYAAAHRMLAPIAQADLSTQQLASQWQAFEGRHGALLRWKIAPGHFVSGGQASAFPRFVQLRYLLQGTRDKNTAAALFVQLVPGSQAEWKISKMELRG